MNAEKIDLLAYLEKRLSAVDRAEVDALLAQSAPLREELAALRDAHELVGKAADKVKDSAVDEQKLAHMANQFLGAMDDEPLSPLPEQGLELPDELKKAVAARRRAHLTGRVAKSLGAVGRAGAQKAKDIAEKLASRAPEPGAAMAIRDDATDVEDQANGPDQGPDCDNGEQER